MGGWACHDMPIFIRMTIFQHIRNEYFVPANQDIYKIWILLGIAIVIFLWCRMWFRTLDGAFLERKANKLQGSVYVCDWITEDEFKKALAVCKVKSIERTTKEGEKFKI